MSKENPNQPKEVTLRSDFQAVKIGDVLPDGWVVGPVSPHTRKPIAIEPVVSALDGCTSWYEGEDHAADLRRQGHANARQPSSSELDATYNQVVKAGRNQHAQFKLSSYWSSSPGKDWQDSAVLQDFDNGFRESGDKSLRFVARVRCVRDEPNLVLTAEI